MLPVFFSGFFGDGGWCKPYASMCVFMGARFGAA